MALENAQRKARCELANAIWKLNGISTDHGLTYTDGCDCSPVPEFLLDVVSYEELKTAFGLLSQIKHAVERKADEAKEGNASVVVETVAADRPRHPGATTTHVLGKFDRPPRNLHRLCEASVVAVGARVTSRPPHGSVRAP